MRGHHIHVRTFIKKKNNKKKLHAFYVKIVRISHLFHYVSRAVLFSPCKIVTVSGKIDHLNSSGRFTGGRSRYVTPCYVDEV